MYIQLKILRFHPEKDKQPHYEKYEVDVDPNDRILDVLEWVRGHIDESLAFRRSCAHGVCGSDAMRINGQNMVACKILVKELGTNRITIEPLIGLRVIKDLVVDMKPFFDHYESIKPYLLNDDSLPEDGRERLQSPEERDRFDDTTRCILCAACTTSCPSFWSNGKYIGPAAIVNAHRFIFDSRDRNTAERLKIMAGEMGVWRCRTVFNCTEACPRGIQITKAIAEVKRTLVRGKLT
jgi:succinate dehydrogenase / fumarate reductase, iron-sulfur subunit